MIARLFPDYAAAPTPTERATARRNNQRLQTSMFDLGTAPAQPCPACGSTDHDTTRCRYAALALDLNSEVEQIMNR